MSRDFEIGNPVVDGDSATVAVRVPEDLRYFEGHFPHDPVVPGVAQLLLVEEVVRRAFPDLDRPRSVRRVKFNRRIDPGASITVVLARSDVSVRFVVHDADENEVSRGSLGYVGEP